VFTTYASYDGQAWSQLSSTSLSLPATLYFGMAVSSRNTSQAATASFRSISDVSSATTFTYVPAGEGLGPSSRQTPLVISEIMYHPKERADGLTAEFIELYNGDLIPQDLSGYSISGSVDFTFPNGYVIPAGAFAVIARNPVEFAAVYGISVVLGPFVGTNSLPNGTGTVRLRNPERAILLEVEYGSQAPWPVAADGGGHSLVLTKPSYGEGDARAWATSSRVGGSPGQMETISNDPLDAVVINEFLAHTDEPQLDYVELFNHGTSTVDLSGCVITDDPATNRYRIPNGTIISARGLLAFDQNQLGFRLNAAGEMLFLISSNGTRVVDAVSFDAQENGVASGRYPDGASEARPLSRPTPGAENETFRIAEVVINEIMYNPISGDGDDEFVEVYNRSASAVDISGWRFTDGIDFVFPAGATLPANAYAVVARNPARLLTNYTGLAANQVYGPFDGTLANGGERLELARPGQS
jgi:hypothetical protein